MITLALLALLLDGPRQTLAVSAEGTVRVPCPVHAVTRVRFPEPLRELRLARAERLSLGVRIVASSPQALIEVSPTVHPRRALLRFRGPDSSLSLELETTASGSNAEIDLVRSAAEPPAASPSPVTIEAATMGPSPSAPPPPSPAGADAPAGSTEAAPAPSRPPATAGTGPAPGPASVVFDLSSLLRATPVSIGRREGLPGQPPMVLVDALRGEALVWLRFTLENGAAERIKAVSWEQGAIPAFTQEPVGRDLRVVVQLPRGQVTRKTRVVLETVSGGRYRFALSSGTLAGFFRSLFE
jgi:hypothetical protein